MSEEELRESQIENLEEIQPQADQPEIVSAEPIHQIVEQTNNLLEEFGEHHREGSARSMIERARQNIQSEAQAPEPVAVPPPEPEPDKEATLAVEAPWDDIATDFVICPLRQGDSLSYKNRRFMIRNKEIGENQWLYGIGIKSYKSRHEAEIYHSSQLDMRVPWDNESFEVHILKEKMPAPGCKITDHFDQNFIGALEKHPNNMVLRAHVMKKLLVGPPRELDTYEKIKGWIETTFAPSANMQIGPIGVIGSPVIQPSPELERARSPVNGQPAVTLVYEKNGEELGRCRYRIRSSGAAAFQITLQNLRDWIEGEAASETELIDYIEEYAKENIDVYPEPIAGADYNHEEYEEGGFEVDSSGLNGDPLGSIREFLHRQCPELLETLDNN